MSAPAKPGPRERLLDAAQKLTYTHGVNVGVDALLREANVARRSLYEHFGGKDGLIAAVLQRSTAEDEADYRRVMQAAGDHPRDRLLAVFDRLAEVVAGPDFHGCRYLAADLALVERDHPAHEIVREYHRRVHQLLEDDLTALGHPRPAHAADQFLLLIDGTLAAGATRPGTDPAAHARELAEQILVTSQGLSLKGG
ncbi:TetR/AcrR family transcriptional regulator [Nonomuraea africana]|uniref:AcrR family transcriptional regulator n=1 Tax=Nonomuraea africana TaxID=46171 RepID=A0ABR9KDP1_9ACTN|nr:TetR/AcrR family transcriptional regulator [Nonomuraea africana]MBE1559931.1 AcrR family transcriptional regulator [Nonomuraea africana]